MKQRKTEVSIKNFMQFAKNGRKEELEKMCHAKKNIDKEVDDEGNNITHYLALGGQNELIKNNYFHHIWKDQNKKGETALHFAATTSLDCVKTLIDVFSFKYDDRTNSGFIPLHYAVANSEKESIKYLLKFPVELLDLNIAIDICSSFETQDEEIIKILQIKYQNLLTNRSKFSHRDPKQKNRDSYDEPDDLEKITGHHINLNPNICEIEKRTNRKIFRKKSDNHSEASTNPLYRIKIPKSARTTALVLQLQKSKTNKKQFI